MGEMSVSSRPLPPSCEDKTHPAGVVFLILPVDVDVNLLARMGKAFPWPAPACPFCGQTMWGHGFVASWLGALGEAVFLRRLYCPHCHTVHRLRPSSHWRRFQSSIETIEQTVAHREGHGCWRPDLPRGRQRQWWRRLARKARLCLGESFGNAVNAFRELCDAGAIPVSRLMQCGEEIV